ncbi:MAG: hypothetical protein K2O00_00140 [Muribaculaceae bacterium]|nr:hypothetical protein [Muribaculaceae bacterium]
MRFSLRNLAFATLLFGTGVTLAQTADHSYFPYSLRATHQAVNVNTFSFYSGGDAASAVLYLKKVGTDEVKAITLPGTVTKGENSYDINLTDYVDDPVGTTYTWSIELHNYPIPQDIVSGKTSIGGNRGGVVCMTDPTNEFYGYMVIARTKNGGFDVYDPSGKKIHSAIHKSNAAMGGASATTSNPMRGVQRGTTAQFADWHDSGIGVVALDLANIDAAPFGVFEGTKIENGTTMNGDIAVGSGTPCVAYVGEGENTLLMTFDEDIFKNSIAANPIGTAMTTGKAAVNWGFKSELSNTNVGMVGTKNGLFVSQTRANGMDQSTVGLAYIIRDGEGGNPEMIWRASDEAAAYPAFLPTTTGGVDINSAGDMLAISTYTGINVYKLSWADDGKPILVPYKVITTANQASNYTTVKFDAGNNLHVINQTNGYYEVVLGNEESVITTPAMQDNTVELFEEPEVTSDRGQFAYNLKQTLLTANTYTFSFDATGDAASAVLILKQTGSDEVNSIDLGEVKEGANEFNVDLSDYAPETTAEFNWSIEIHNNAIVADKVTKAVSIGGNRGGVVCMTDPTNEFYGFTVIGRTQNGGFDIYDPTGKKIYSAIHKTNAAMGGTAANTSCPMRGVQRGTTAQFACWGDAANGVVALDLANIDAAPFGVFEGTNNGKGAIMNGDIAVGSGTPGAVYVGEGENTVLYTMDEDIFGNNFAANPIGASMTTGKAAVNLGLGSGAMVNHNVGMVAVKGKNAIFFSQIRTNGMESTGTGLGYLVLPETINSETKPLGYSDVIWNASSESAKYPEFLVNSTGGVDINPAGDLLAVSTYTGINVYKLSWDGEMPVLEPYKSIPSKYQASNYTDLKFDAGNNIHVINQTNGYYQVILGQDENIATTAAAEPFTMQVVTSVENVGYDEQDATPVYYNLMGVRVDGELTPGIYVKVVGKKATKVVVK